MIVNDLLVYFPFVYGSSRFPGCFLYTPTERSRSPTHTYPHSLYYQDTRYQHSFHRTSAGVHGRIFLHYGQFSEIQSPRFQLTSTILETPLCSLYRGIYTRLSSTYASSYIFGHRSLPCPNRSLGISGYSTYIHIHKQSISYKFQTSSYTSDGTTYLFQRRAPFHRPENSSRLRYHCITCVAQRGLVPYSHAN